MPLDSETFSYLLGEFEKEKSRETRRYEQMLEQKLGMERHLLIGSEEERAQKRAAIEKNFWLKHKPELNKLHQSYEAKYFKDYGGSRASAQQLIKEDTLNHKFNQAMNDNKNDLSKQYAEEQDNKKKEKKKKQEAELKQQKQNSFEDEKKRRTEQIKQRRLNNEFDRKK